MARTEYCSAVFIDDRVRTERWVRRNSADDSNGVPIASGVLADECATLQTTIDSLLDVCKQIYLCHSGKSFAATLAGLNEHSGSDCTPIFAFFDVESRSDALSLRRRETRDSLTGLGLSSSAPLPRGFTFSSESEDSYGIQLLALLSSDLQLQEGPKLIIPVAILRRPEQPTNDSLLEGSRSFPSPQLKQSPHLLLSEPSQVARCLDAGAVDVLTQPLERARIHGLMVHAYRVRRAAQKEISRFMAIKKSRKQSWVGVHNEQPYAYLREAMVSKLMKSICNPEEVIEEFQDRELNVVDARKLVVERKIGDWDFCAHDFSEDELVYGACKILEHALTMPEVGNWRLTEGELRTFLLASRATYNSFVLYHNFRHAIDVLQSVFNILLHIGALPPYPPSSPIQLVSKSPIASLITPFDSLALLISAIGHDVGHPGVNNVFLVKLNAPLAQLYNDSSVLEAFHCAAFSQILRRHWSAAFKCSNLRKLLISSILATDMGVHFKFMQRMADLQKKFKEDENVDKWNASDIESFRTLICGLIIKCADISNVARPWQIAEKWTNILQQEFANQGEMEKEVGMETALFGGPPELGNLFKLATGQINFMSIFALPLFEGVAELCPQTFFTVQQIQSNRSIWRDLANRERRRSLLSPETDSDFARSPRSVSPAAPTKPLRGSQDDDIRDQAPVSSVQENGVGAHVGPNVKITLDQPPDSLIDSENSSVQKQIADNLVDLSSTTVSGFQTPSQGSNITGCSDGDRSSAAPSVTDRRFHTPESTEAALTARLETQHNRKSYSSGHASLPSSSYGPGRDTRTQSASTCTNTVATPVSPATNATSFVTVDSGDERDHPGYRLGGSDLDVTENENSSRPTSSGLYAVMDRQRFDTSNYYPQQPRSAHRLYDYEKNQNVMTTIYNGINSRGSSPIDPESLKYDNGVRLENQPTSAPRTLQKRRSRLRLAFWKRKAPACPHQPHQVSGEY